MAKNESNQPVPKKSVSEAGSSTSDAVAKPGTLKNRKRKPAEPVVYVGPSLTDPYLPTTTIFRNGPPERLADLIKEDKDLARLFVPVAGLAKAREDLGKPGHPMLAAAGAVAKRYRRRAA